MDCPKCDGKMREMELMESITIDMCPKCRGIWYDKGEVGFQQELERDIPELENVQKTKRPTENKCPRCGAKLEEMRYSTASDLMIDRCPACEGIFLDKGELRKIESIVAHLDSFTARLARAMKDIDSRGYFKRKGGPKGK